MKPTKTQEKVMCTLYGNEAGMEGEMLLNYSLLEDKTGFNHRQLKGAITGLRFHKLVEHVPAVDLDGVPCGSGFKLTQSGHYMARTFDEVKKGIEAGEYD